MALLRGCWGLLGRWSVNDKIVLGRCLGMDSMVMGCAGGRRAVSSSGGRVVVTGLGTVRPVSGEGDFNCQTIVRFLRALIRFGIRDARYRTCNFSTGGGPMWY